jgi:hypothetical protein
MMRKKVFRVALTSALLAVMAAATAYAQMPGTTLRATIPFDFSVRGKMLRAGDYEIKRITDDPGELTISSVNHNHERAAFNTEAVEPKRDMSSKPRIVFHRYGDRYFMFEVFAAGSPTGRELPMSREERNLRRELASNKSEAETVTVAAY